MKYSWVYIPAADNLEILALAELAFAAAAVEHLLEDTYAVADVGVDVGLHNWYKLNKNTNWMVHVTNALSWIFFGLKSIISVPFYSTGSIKHTWLSLFYKKS